MTQENLPPSKPSFGERLSLAFVAFARALMRLLLLLVVGLLVGLGVYVGYPWLYDRYILPVEENTRRLATAEAYQSGLSAQLTQSAGEMQGRLATLDAQRAADAATIAALQAQLDEMKTALQTRLDSDEAALAASLERLAAMETALAEVDTVMGEMTATLAADSALLQSLASEVRAPNASVEALRRELQLVKAMEFITRSRVFLGQSNFGLAKVDVQAARDLLAALKASTPPHQQEALDAIIARLDLALGNLPDSPVLAADDLEIAWQLLVAGLPASPPAPFSGGEEGTPTPGATFAPSATPTVTPASEATPTVTPVITVTATLGAYP